jgi:hypothetical protein
MKKYIYCLLLLPAVLAGSSCKKYLDVNHDPNNPLTSQENLLLFPIETAISTAVAGGALTLGNFTTITVTDDYWMQQLALNQTAPQVDEYKLRPADVDQIFLTSYSTCMFNLLLLNNLAESNGNHAYGAISKILSAYMMGVVTDHWGDIPYSKGFYGKLKVPYDKQEDVYKAMQVLLDSAILEKGLDAGKREPGSDDQIYQGNMDAWEKFAYALKARYYIHLTKAPGYDAATQSNLALDALSKSFQSDAEEAKYAFYTGAPTQESPWSLNIDASQGGVVCSSTLIDSLVARNDPRLPILTVQGTEGDSGRVIGSPIDPDFTVYSTVGSFYADPAAPSYILTYEELVFIKAEAVFRTQGAAAATPIYIHGINAHMHKLGLDTTSAEVTSYIASRSPLTTSNGMELMMQEKALANFLSMENFTDWRRTGHPALTIVKNAYVPTMPRRYPYPLAEISTNPQPEQSADVTDRVWWDAP